MNRQQVVRALSGPPARFLVVLFLLLLPWPPLGRAYAHVVAALGDVTIGPAGAPIVFQFRPADSHQPWVLRIRADDPSNGRFVETALDLRRAGYIASAVFTALVLVTALRWRRRLGVLGAGLAILQLVPLVALLSFFSGKLPVQAFHLPSIGRWIIEIAYRSLVAAPGMAYAVPLVLWLLMAGPLHFWCGKKRTGPYRRRRVDGHRAASA